MSDIRDTGNRNLTQPRHRLDLHVIDQSAQRPVRPVQGVHDLIGDVATAVVKTGTGNGSYPTTLTVTTNYIFEPLNADADGEPVTRIRRSDGQLWPTSLYGAPQVQITARWGWPVVPAPVRQATLQAASELWTRRNTPLGVLQSVEFGPIRLSKDAMASVSSLLSRYQTGVAAVALA